MSKTSAVLLIVMLCSACNGESIVVGGPVSARYSSVHLVNPPLTRAGVEWHGVAPITLNYYIGSAAGNQDTGKWWTKVEVDFGDGSGWIDVTSHVDQWILNLKGSPHEYTDPGTYEIRGKVTYWDGEVLYSDLPNQLFVPEKTIIVLEDAS